MRQELLTAFVVCGACAAGLSSASQVAMATAASQTTGETDSVLADVETEATPVLASAAPAGVIPFLEAQDSDVRATLARSPTDSLSASLRSEVKSQINKIFDFNELARLALGTHWDSRTQAERSEFSDTFRQIIEERNFDSFVRYYREGNIEYSSEQLDGSRATVTAEVPLERERISIHYLLHRVGSGEKAGWRIYDLVIDGASTAEGYRRQYARYIGRHSYEKLIELLRAQLARLGQRG